MVKILLGVLGSLPALALVGSLLVKIARKYWPPKKCRPICKKGGKIISAFGRSKWGRRFYEGIETYVQECLKESHEGFDEGLDLDDKKV